MEHHHPRLSRVSPAKRSHYSGPIQWARGDVEALRRRAPPIHEMVTSAGSAGTPSKQVRHMPLSTGRVRFCTRACSSRASRARIRDGGLRLTTVAGGPTTTVLYTAAPDSKCPQLACPRLALPWLPLEAPSGAFWCRLQDGRSGEA